MTQTDTMESQDTDTRNTERKTTERPEAERGSEEARVAETRTERSSTPESGRHESAPATSTGEHTRREDDTPARSETSTDAPSGTTDRTDEDQSILSSDERESLKERWERVQAEFIDQPKGSVEEADRLVSDVTDRIVDSFQSRRSELEKAWSQGDDVSTETLRVTLKRYRSFFDRLLSI